MKLKILALTVALTFASAAVAEAGPIRNLLRRCGGRAKAVAKKVVKAPAAVRGGCANGQCSR